MLEVFDMDQGSEERYGRLTLVRPLPERSGDNHILGLWRCDCGAEKPIAMSRVRLGYSKSCGCLSRDVSRVNNRKHGLHGTDTYSSWRSMKERCLNPRCKDYPRWGGSGVTVCAEWAESFEAFLAHVGLRPQGTTLDRIDNAHGYEPGNVRWATSEQQATNRRNSWVVDIHGTQYPSIEAAARDHGVSTTTIKRWCEGFVDPRRADQVNHGYTPARTGCTMWRKYAA